MQRPFVPLLGSLIGGIILGHLLDIPDGYAFALGGILLFAIFTTLRQRKYNFVFLFSFFALVNLGVLLMNAQVRQPLLADDVSRFIGKEKVIVEGIIESIDEVSVDRITITTRLSRLIVNDSWQEVRGRVILGLDKSADLTDQIGYGDYIRCQVKFNQFRNFKNPGGFNQERHLRYRGLQAQGNISKPSDLMLIRKGGGNFLWRMITTIRLRIIDFVSDNSPLESAAVILAMTVGQRGGISEQTKANFRQSGTAHILAISGLHVGIVAFLAIFLIQRLLQNWQWLALRLNIRFIAHLAAIFPVIFYALIAGGSISVVRATVMIIVLMLALLLGRQRDLLNILALAGFLILIVSPLSLFDVSFQLSFTAVAAILFITPLLETNGSEKHDKKIRLLSLIGGWLAVSFSATLGTWPLIAHYFYIFSPVSLFANILVVPLMGFLALPLSFGAILTSGLCPPLAKLLLFLAAGVVEFNLALIGFLVALPHSWFIVVPPTIWQLACYYLLLFLVTRRLVFSQSQTDVPAKTVRNHNFAIGAIILIFIFNGIFGFVKSRYSDEMRVTAIDVGQGSAALIELPRGKRILIDGGGATSGRFDIGRNVVAPVLLQRGIKNIDLIILSHPHSDHYKGLIYIINNFNVREVWTNGQRIMEPDFFELMDVIDRKKVYHHQVTSRTSPVNLNGAVLTILNPEAPPAISANEAASYEDTNNASLVIRLTYGQHSLLFTGDIMAQAEEDIMRRNGMISSQVLFVPHHGSRTSSTPAFLKAVNPRIAVISSGAELSYPLPHPETLARINDLGAMVLRTDIHGAITIKSDGRILVVNTQVNP